MIKPTIGRVVWFYPSGMPSFYQPLAAMISYVHSDHLVNLAIFDPYGVASNKTSCVLIQENDEKPTGDYCTWMPYQIGQAKKTEELETKLSEK